MKKVNNYLLALLCLLFTRCAEEEPIARLPVDCQGKDCFEPPKPPKPVEPTSVDVFSWLSQQEKKYSQGSCSAQMKLWSSNSYGSTSGGMYISLSGILQGFVYYHGTKYYKIDIYRGLKDFTRFKSLYPPSVTPAKIGTVYVGRTDKKPHAGKYYAGRSPLKKLIIYQGKEISGKTDDWSMFTYHTSTNYPYYYDVYAGVLSGACYIFR